VAAGDVLGTCFENELFNEHKIMIPPKVYGRVVEVMPKGNYNCSSTVAVIDFDGKQKEIKLSHFWPVRGARPCAEKLAGKVPLLTG